MKSILFGVSYYKCFSRCDKRKLRSYRIVNAHFYNKIIFFCLDFKFDKDLDKIVYKSKIFKLFIYLITTII